MKLVKFTYRFAHNMAAINKMQMILGHDNSITQIVMASSSLKHQLASIQRSSFIHISLNLTLTSQKSRCAIDRFSWLLIHVSWHWISSMWPNLCTFSFNLVNVCTTFKVYSVSQILLHPWGFLKISPQWLGIFD